VLIIPLNRSAAFVIKIQRNNFFAPISEK